MKIIIGSASDFSYSRGSFTVVTAELAAKFKVPITRAETTNICGFLATAGACILSSGSPRLFGKRLIYLVAIAILFTSATRTAAATTFNSILASRIVYGFGLGAFEPLPWSSVGDMYFLCIEARRVGQETCSRSRLGASARKTDCGVQFHLFGWLSTGAGIERLSRRHLRLED